MTGGLRVSSTSWRYREDIDGLRALAVAIVILFHLEVGWIPGGFIGVDVFFVISGFLITSLISRQIVEGRFSLIDFYERRFRRIYPNLLIVLTVTAILGFIAMVPMTYRPFGRNLIWATLSASNFSFIGGDGYFDPDNLTKPLLHTWSLGVEEQFYLVFPGLLILVAKRGYDARWLIGIVVGLSLALSIGAALVNWAPAYFLLPTRFWELGIGGLIAILPPSNHLSYAQRSILGIAGLIAIGWATLRLTDADPFPGYLALAPTLGAAVVIWANGGLAGRILSLRPFIWTGRLSFALYLWHWPLISIAAGIGLPPTNNGSRIVIVAIIFALSLAGYFLWEQPIRQRRILESRKSFFVALSVFAALIIALGAAIFQTKGIPQRLPKDLAEIEKITKNESFYIAKRCPALITGEVVPCPLGDEGANLVSFVIIGDSHAQAAAAEIGDLAKSYHLRGLYLGRAGCPPIKLLTRTPSSSCAQHYEFAKSQIEENNPRLVILISQWTALTGDPEGGYKTPLFSKGDPIAESRRLPLVTSAVDETLTDIGARKIVTALTVPEYNDQPSIVWERWTERLGLPQFTAALTLKDYRDRQIYVKSMLDQAQETFSNLDVLDPSPIFCKEEICTRAVGEKILYRDNSHLSHLGAEIYAKMFEPYFASLAEQK